MTETFNKHNLTGLIMDIIPVSSRGQIVIPEHIRKKYHIKKGTRLVLQERGAALVLKKEIDVEKMLRAMSAEDRDWLLLVEQSLAKEWNTPEEDAAWKDL